LSATAQAILTSVGVLVVTFLALRVGGRFVLASGVDPSFSRKMLHVVVGLIWILSWPLYAAGPWSRWAAAAVPGLLGLYAVLIAAGVVRDERFLRGLSRTGAKAELLRGPVLYAVAFVVVIIVYWRESPIGLAALTMLCVGDGLAAIVGPRVRSRRLPWSPRKTLAGSSAAFAGGWIAASVILALFTAWGLLDAPWTARLVPLAFVALCASIVESLPFREIDNLTMTAAGIAAGHFVF